MPNFKEKSRKHDTLTKGDITMNADRIAKNARLVWNILKKTTSRMTFIDMIVQTKLHATDLAYAIGWLAREDRIGMIEENGKQYFLAY
jgi:hypothetical protein